MRGRKKAETPRHICGLHLTYVQLPRAKGEDSHEIEAKEVFKQGGVAFFDVGGIDALRRPRNCNSAWNVSDATPSGIIYAWEPEWCYHWWRPTPPDSQGRNSKVVGARTTGFGPEWGLNEFN